MPPLLKTAVCPDSEFCGGDAACLLGLGKSLIGVPAMQRTPPKRRQAVFAALLRLPDLADRQIAWDTAMRLALGLNAAATKQAAAAAVQLITAKDTPVLIKEAAYVQTCAWRNQFGTAQTDAIVKEMNRIRRPNMFTALPPDPTPKDHAADPPAA